MYYENKKADMIVSNTGSRSERNGKQFCTDIVLKINWFFGILVTFVRLKSN